MEKDINQTKVLRVAVGSFAIAEAVLIVRACALCMLSSVINIYFVLNQYSARWSAKGIVVTSSCYRMQLTAGKALRALADWIFCS